MFSLLRKFFAQSSSSPRTANRSFRPELEALEERRVLSSSTGLLSSITDNFGHTVTYAIGSDHNVYRNDGGSSWSRTNQSNFGDFDQVSAGLDSSGHACAYAIAGGDRFWVMPEGASPYFGVLSTLTATSSRMRTFQYAPLLVTQIAGTASGDCYAVTPPGVRYTSTGWDVDPSSSLERVVRIQPEPNGHVSVTDLGAPGAHLHLNFVPTITTTFEGGTSPREISVGFDRNGRSEVYARDAQDDVWLSGPDGAWHDLHFYATHISAGIRPESHDVLFAVGLGNNALYCYDGNPAGHNGGFTYLAGAVKQISAAVDAWGNDTCYAIGMNDSLWLRDGAGWHDEGGQITQLTAARDAVFAVAPNSQVWSYVPAPSWQSWRAPITTRQPFHGWYDTGLSVADSWL